MRRNIILAVVVVVALTIAGVGGVFATWADSEISHDNIIRTGSLDLKVNGADDEPWGTGVPLLVDIECMIPDKYYGPYKIELWNAGQCQFASHAYLHLKSYNCSNIEPKINPYPKGGSAYWAPNATTGYPAPDDDPNAGQLKPEPELVAEHGGKVNCVTVPGIGAVGDECSMGSHIWMYVTGTVDAPLTPNVDIIYASTFEKWLCKEIYLFDLMPCVSKTIYLWFYMEQESEELWGYDLINPDPGDKEFPDQTTDPIGYAAAMLHWQKFNDWPSWALMKDQVVFDLEFDLWLEDTPGGVVNPNNTM